MKVSEVMQTNGLQTCPNCDECKRTEAEMKEDGKVFLMAIGDRLVCGRCAIKLSQPVVCVNPACKVANRAGSNFCYKCGVKIQ